MQPEAAISLRGLRKTFGAETVLHGLDLDISNGEFMVFVGPSGCAKSTTLRLIAGLEKATAGTIRVDGRDITNMPSAARNLAMVFQSYALYPNMTVRGNLAFGMKVRREDPATIKSEVNRAAELLGLGAMLDRKPGSLSGGQAQRVALGRAILRRPDAYLFDEPLSNLDAELRTQMRTEIVRLQRELAVATIYVTHDQTEAMTMGRRIAVMRKGELMQVGTPIDLYRDPDNLFVAGFLGSPKMNFFTGKANAGALSALGSRMPLPAGVAEGSEITMGIRPEHIMVGEGSVHATVEQVEALGHEVMIVLRACGAGCDDLAFTARLAGELDASFAAGSEVRLDLPADRALFFETGSGKRIRR